MFCTEEKKQEKKGLIFPSVQKRRNEKHMKLTCPLKTCYSRYSSDACRRKRKGTGHVEERERGCGTSKKEKGDGGLVPILPVHYGNYERD